PPPEPVSFRNDVMAVLSKAGCNAGPCHGNQNGKAGFKLSLRGEDAEFDHRALTRDVFARRVDPENPEQSLVLLKPTTQLAHEGGLRFRTNSGEYAILRRWIAAGAPDDGSNAPTVVRLEVTPRSAVLIEPAREVQIRAEAFFSDGTRRDVTSLAVYDPASTAVWVSHVGVGTGDLPVVATVLGRFVQAQEPVRVEILTAGRDLRGRG